MSLELVTIGETMLRLTAPPGFGLENAPHFLVHTAGAESNVAVMLSRFGHRTGWVSKLVNDALGRRIAHDIRAHGVDTSRVVWVPAGKTGSYYLELPLKPRTGRVIYDRSGSAASQLGVEDVDWEYVESARAIHLTGITPALSPNCQAVVAEALARARRRGALISFDVNYRSRLWPSERAAHTISELLAAGLSVLFCTADDASTLFGATGPAAQAASRLKHLFPCDVAVVTSGDRCAAVTSEKSFEAEGYPIEALDRVGSGDAFAAGFLHGYLQGDVGAGLQYGMALAALKHTFFGDVPWIGPVEAQALISGDRSAWR